MKNRLDFLPTTAEDIKLRNWSEVDFVYVTGDAYVDHPSFGASIITRVLEAEGFRVAVLAQPDYKTTKDFCRFGRPRLGFLVTSGNIDSMVAHYTVSKKRRTYDYYSPGGKMGARPDRAVIVYCNRIREAYGDVPIIIGGLETIESAARCWLIQEPIYSHTVWARILSEDLQGFLIKAFPSKKYATFAVAFIFVKRASPSILKA